MNEEREFVAFISYRHCPLDIRVAETLHKMLERYRVPKDLCVDGNKHLGLVFRDRDELPLTSNLTDDIYKALDQAQFLIVVCTPETPKSKWVEREIQYFIENHGRERILTVLAAGTPEESIPKVITEIYAEDGRTVLTQVEPLCAYLVDESEEKILKNLKKEFLRLAAAILGCPYDALVQRQKRYRAQQITYAAVGLAAVALLFVGMLVNRNQQITKEHHTILANESRRLAEAAEEEIDNANNNLALLLALEALPKDLDDPERPIIPEAEAALRSAVYSRMIQGELSLLQNIARIDFSSIYWEYNSAFFDNFSKIYCAESGSLYIYDTANGMLLLEAPMGISGFYWFNSTMSHVLVTSSNSYNTTSSQYSIYEIVTGQTVYQNTYESAADYSDDIAVTWDPEKDICYFLSVADDREPILLDAVYADGTPAPKRTISSDQLEEWWRKRALDFPQYPLSMLNSTDYKKSVGPVSDLGVRYQAVIEKKWIDSDQYAYISEDECLLIIHNSDNSNRVYSLKDDFKVVRLEGDCTVDELNQRLYVTQDTSLLIYSYQPAKKSAGITIDRISNDGQRCMKETYLIDGVLTDHGTISNTTPEYLLIWDYNDLTEPLLQIRFESYYLTTDMRYALVVSEENTLQLWHAYEGLVIEIPLQEEVPLLPCVSMDGSLLAVVCYEQQTVDVYSSDGERIRQIPIPMQHNINEDNYSEVTQLEFEGSKLMISCSCEGVSGYTQIWDIPSGDAPLIIEGYSGNENMESQECLLTSDGLLFCVGTVFGDAVDTIYDLETGEIIFQQTAFFRYDEESKMLIYAPVGPQFPDMATIHAACRDETGMFRDIYTFETKAGSFSLRYAVQAMDTDYFLLNGEGVCEAYEIATGESVMTIRTDYTDNLFCISNGVIYFTGCHPDTAGEAFLMMELPELMEIAKSYLTSDTSIRILTNTEKAKFYIE